MAIKKKKVAFLYPGQGAQMPGMGLDFYEQNSAAAAVVDTAQSVLDFDVKSLCFAKNDLLNRTEYTQPCLVTCCLAMTAAILETGIAPNMTAGLSLGEYAAIATAGAMDMVRQEKSRRQRISISTKTVLHSIIMYMILLRMQWDRLQYPYRFRCWNIC